MKPGELTERDWDQFFDALSCIVNGPGAWTEKLARLKSEAVSRGEDGNLEELAVWLSEG